MGGVGGRERGLQWAASLVSQAAAELLWAAFPPVLVVSLLSSQRSAFSSATSRLYSGAETEGFMLSHETHPLKVLAPDPEIAEPMKSFSYKCCLLFDC